MLADHVYQDAQTGKYIICGIFDRIMLLRMPKTDEASSDAKPAASYLRSGNPYLYFALTDYFGPLTLDFHYVDLSNNHSLMVGKVENLTASSPLELIQRALPMPRLPTPHPGQYSLDLLFNGEVLGAIRVSVTDHELSSEANDANT